MEFLGMKRKAYRDDASRYINETGQKCQWLNPGFGTEAYSCRMRDKMLLNGAAGPDDGL